ncbi:4Fe-4S dicluster domain-containing protein [Methanothermococcus okinawensis]|uniref:4Fe-4S ferredoxin iron-sulfur binding domain-containing protein n=1 Tax=Methanothermococcus okinawensis (strain DSM 14208 / JCM 11175 / IH1) TaxID=647113 RepID=F8AMA1_METOI|nr:ferredoxin family protein [Methanothermococcus okinawensis]AEH06791.1 4Fe-4S ferredoxin iron-sulfur binding domain-containing protein [Methanothermococcus okinawensis IH1]
MKIEINEKYCKGCDICIYVCPRDVFVKSDKLNKKGVYPPVAEHPEKCTNCQLCVLECPDQAVSVEVDEE